MATTNNTKRIAAALLLGLLAAGASAQNGNGNGNGNGNYQGNDNNGNNGDNNGDNGDHVIAVPEPGTLALLGTSAAALGLAMFLRRRKS